MNSISEARSPRFLATGHAIRIKNRANGGKESDDLLPGEQRLYSFYAPSLEAGPHTVSVKQDIRPRNGEKPKTILSTQEFTVIAPRFTLPPNSIHSTYPPQGGADLAKTLPHVVLNDPYLPWERVASDKVEEHPKKNRVPWLAVLVFTQDELCLEDRLLNGDLSIFAKTREPEGGTAKQPIIQNATLSINMAVSDLPKTKDITTPITPDDDELARADVIFVKAKLFNNLVTASNVGEQPQERADVSRYKFLAHVRNVNTQGMASANGTPETSFGVVVSHRVGPLDITQPTPVVVHLVSIEGVESLSFPVSTEFVGLSSLHSWTYTCLPPGSLDVLSTFRTLGNTLGLLRAPEKVMDKMKNQRARQRLKDGYSLVRYLTQTGEETVALTRSPFTPTTVKHPLRPGWALSTFGTDLQILDHKLGLMDITYSAAWQLGRALGLADHGFSAALSRVRAHILDEAMKSAKVNVMTERSPGVHSTREQALGSLAGAVEALHALVAKEKSKYVVKRWQRPPVPAHDLSYGSEAIDPIIEEHAIAAAKNIASSTDGEIYDELNTPCSTDWMVIFKWILDRMYLVNVPAHYLITDPTHLPPESLRFFHIDANWVDALVDGALSLANHVENYDDKIRTVIKGMMNTYLKRSHPIVGYPPQMPTYGFLLRSDICSQFPDLVVKITPEVDGAPILYHKNLDKGVMLCLFDRVPSSPEFQSLSFTQPPHQQCFSAGDSLDLSQLEMQYKWIYTNPPPGGGALGSDVWKRGDSDTKEPIFLWGEQDSEIRTLLFPAWAQNVFDFNKRKLNETKANSFSDTATGSALVGVQLGSSIYQLTIELEGRGEIKDLQPSDLFEKTPRSLEMLHPEKPAKPKPVVVPTPQSKPPMIVSKPPPRVPRPDTFYHKYTTPPPSHSEYIADPEFICKVRSAKSRANEVLMKTGDQDLVFSIQLGDFERHDLDLVSFTVIVPLGKVGDENASLMETYHGPVTMLGNLRFNVLPKLTNHALFLKLMPRSMKGKVAIAKINDMGFLLSLARVNVYDKTTSVLILFEALYEGMPKKSSFYAKLVREEEKTSVNVNAPRE